MAASFFDGDTAIFSGRSPRGSNFPTGVNLLPFGRETARDSISFRVCAERLTAIPKKTI